MVRDTVAIGIECGISPIEVWDHTVDEINDFINAYRKRERDKLKHQSALIYKLGVLISTGFNEPDKYPTIDKAFPGMFDDEFATQEEEKQKNAWIRQKALMEDYSIRHNTKFNKEMG